MSATLGLILKITTDITEIVFERVRCWLRKFDGITLELGIPALWSLHLKGDGTSSKRLVLQESFEVSKTVLGLT
jgi:hypothetical protein